MHLHKLYINGSIHDMFSIRSYFTINKRKNIKCYSNAQRFVLYDIRFPVFETAIIASKVLDLAAQLKNPLVVFNKTPQTLKVLNMF